MQLGPTQEVPYIVKAANLEGISGFMEPASLLLLVNAARMMQRCIATHGKQFTAVLPRDCHESSSQHTSVMLQLQSIEDYTQEAFACSAGNNNTTNKSESRPALAQARLSQLGGHA